MNNANSREEQTAKTPSEAPGHEELRGPLEAMRRRLAEHSPLEDLGPLFGPKARGQGPGRDTD